MSDQDEAFRRHEDEQRRARLNLSPLERLRWLQQAKEFARRWRGAAAKASGPKKPD
jgi:hypothetical protein